MQLFLSIHNQQQHVSVRTNLIHDFTAVTFPVKLAFFCDFFVNFNAFTYIYEGFRVLSAAFVRTLLFAMCHT